MRGKLPPQNDNEADVSRLTLDYLVSICSDTLAEYEGAPLLFLSKRYFTAGRNRDFLRFFFQKSYHNPKESIVMTVFLALAQQVTVSSK